MGLDQGVLKVTSQMCRISWRDQIGEKAFKPAPENFKQDVLLHYRISKYFRLYSDMVNVSTYFLLAHRHFLSLFDLRQGTSGDLYCDTISLDSEIKGIALIGNLPVGNENYED